MKDQVLNKILRKKVLWAEIKASEQEYKRLCRQIETLEQAKRDLSFDVQTKLQEAQKIAEWLTEQEWEVLKETE